MNNIAYGIRDKTISGGCQLALNDQATKYEIFFARSDADEFVTKWNKRTADPAYGGPDRFSVIKLNLTPADPAIE
jgi:hypothetical protein